MQALFTVAMNSRVTAVLTEVPAGGDQLSPEVGRLASYPAQFDQARDRDLAKVRQACRYYDIVYFAPRIHCPTRVGVPIISQVTKRIRRGPRCG